MKRTLLFFLVIVIISCQKEEMPFSKEFPVLKTAPVTLNGSGSAIFSAEVLDAGQEPALSYGFMVNSETMELDIKFKDINTLSDYSYELTSDMEAGKVYSVYAYARTSKYMSRGNEVTFTAIGSSLPEIDHVTPYQVITDSKVRITGRNFSHLPDGNRVFVNEIEMPILYSSQDSLVFELSRVSFFGEYPVTIETSAGGVTSEDKIEIIGPIFGSISSSSGNPGDTITITGKNFHADDYFLWVGFDDLFAEILSSTDTEIVFQVPPVTGVFEDQHFNAYISMSTKKVQFPFTVKKSWTAIEVGNADVSVSNVLNYENELYYCTAESLFRLDKVNQEWRHLTLLPTEPGRYSHIFAHNNILYFMGGRISYGYRPEYSRETWSYNLITETWLRLSDRPEIPTIVESFQVKNKRIIISPQHLVYGYNLEDDSFEPMENFPIDFIEGRYSSHDSFRFDGKNYVSHTWGLFEFIENTGSWNNTGSWRNIAQMQHLSEIIGYAFTYRNQLHFRSSFQNQPSSAVIVQDHWWNTITTLPDDRSDYFMLDGAIYGFSYDDLSVFYMLDIPE